MKKTQYVKRYGRFGAANGWHFLTGPESAIKRLTNIVGFQYAYDIKIDQFAHGAVLLAVTPQGRVSRYLYGFEYKPRDLRLAPRRSLGRQDRHRLRLNSFSSAITTIRPPGSTAAAR